MDKYEWFPTESAHQDYPMKIIKGDFFAGDNSIYIPDAHIIKKGLGEIGSRHIVGEDVKLLPEYLSIAWFSFVENKFYVGGFQLPTQALKHFFQKGFKSPSNDKYITFKFIVVGLGLQGAISIYLSGDGVVKEIAQFDAKESTKEIDWRHITQSGLNREQYIERTLLQSFDGDEKKLLKAKRHASQENPWHGYRIKYDWNIVIEGTANPLSIWSKTFNGEKEYINYENGQICEKADRSVPESMVLNWQGLNNKKYSTDIFFNTAEIYKAFDKLYASDTKDTLQIKIEIDASSHSLEIYLNNSKYSLPLQKIKIEVFSYA